jgi:hypothetical protein
MAPPRRSNRAPKPKKHYESTPYPPRRPREPIQPTVLPEEVFQPVLAEASLTPDSITHIEYSNFEPIVITEHSVSIHTPEGTRDPITIFSLFFTPAILNLMVTSTNSYAARYHNKHWRPLCLPELYVFIGCLIYMGIHQLPNWRGYWHTQANYRGGTHGISNVMGCTRFEQIQQYLTVVDRGEGLHTSTCWYEPIKPLVKHFRETFRAYIIPGTHLSIDEGMAKFLGRSHDITILPRKPIPEGFKVWLCAYQGYVYAFELHSGKASAERLTESRPIIPDQLFEKAFRFTFLTKPMPTKPREGYRLAETQALVYRFAKDLPQGLSWVVYFH